MSGLNNLKTYITKIENVEKGRVKILIDYLLNKEHGNHSGKTEILNTIIDKKEFWVHNALKIKTNKLRMTWLDIYHLESVYRGLLTLCIFKMQFKLSCIQRPFK